MPTASFRFAAMLSVLAMLGPFSVDAYLPAFPALEQAMQAEPLAIHQTLSAYFIPFALMNLLHGTLSDAFGRRPTLLAAIAVFTAASIGCAAAPSLEALLLFRALQGASAGAGVIAMYAVTQDCFRGADVQRMIAHSTLTYSIAPATAPIVGGLLLSAFGWRSIFVFLAGLGGLLFVFVHRRLPETLPADQRHSLAPRQILDSYRRVLADRNGHYLTGALALSFAAGFLYIAASSVFLTRHLGVSSNGFAWLFLPLVGGSMIGAATAGYLARRQPPRQTIQLGYMTMLLAATLNVALCFAVPPALPLHIVPLCVYAVGQALAAPALKMLVLDQFRALQGTAAAVRGSVQLLALALVAGVIAPLLSFSAASLALGMLAMFLASGVCWCRSHALTVGDGSRGIGR